MLKVRHLTLCLAFLISAGCTHSGPTIKMLEERAEYDAFSPESAVLAPAAAIGVNGEASLAKAERQIADIWIYPHQAGTREYFGGGWVSILLEGDRWEFTEPRPAAALKKKTLVKKSSDKAAKK